MDNKEPTFLVDHLSPSSISLFLTDRFAFKKKYIDKIYDDPKSPSGVVGSALHFMLQKYYGDCIEKEDAIRMGIAQMEAEPDAGIKWGKTGSREGMLKDYIAGATYFFQEEPKLYGDGAQVVSVEKKMTHRIAWGGKEYPFPIKNIIDMVHEPEKGVIEIIDWKFVKAYSEKEEAIDNPNYIMQAMCNYYTAEKEYGISPRAMHFMEMKLSKNKDNTPQMQPYTIVFAEHPEYFTFFHNILNDVATELMKPDVAFLPNFNAMFSGDNSFQIYLQGLMGTEAPVIQAHKLKQETFVEKQYVESAHDKEENRYLTPDEKVRLKLQEFAIPVAIQESYVGPQVTKYTFKVSKGVRMDTILKHEKDIALALKATSIRIEAPIPGTDLIGVEVPNEVRTYIEDNSKERTGLELPIGMDVYGKTIIKDLAEMPHLMIAGATGTGKSVMINVIIKSLLEQNTPEQLRLVLIDPKRVELGPYNQIAREYMDSPVIYDENKALRALKWLIDEMEERYTILEQGGYRNITQYRDSGGQMASIVVVIDEFADLILVSDKMAETFIVRLAQKARAIGIHLIIATQRPSVDVVTGLLKANLPTRIAFMTASSIDSRVILDQAGAEELIGKGDLLFMDPHNKGLQRLQGFYTE